MEITVNAQEEKLYFDIENWAVFLSPVSPDDNSVEGTSQFVNIIKPGIYIIEGEKRTVDEPFVMLKKIWARLNSHERAGFLNGLEAAEIPPAKLDDGIPF